MNRPTESLSSYGLLHHAARTAIPLCLIFLLLLAPAVTAVGSAGILRRALSTQQSPGVPGASAQKNDALSELELRKVIERELGTGESHSHQD